MSQNGGARNIIAMTPPSGMDLINANHVLCDRIFASSSPANIIRYSRTCRSAYHAVSSYCLRAFNINHHLARFFSQPLDFRSLQARTGVLVSGSCALQFFDRTLYPDSDLDLYVDWRYCMEVGHWLIGDGYEFKPRKNSEQTCFDMEVGVLHANEPAPPISTELVLQMGDNPYFMRGVASVFNFFKKTPQGDDLKVQMITASLTPMEIILQFHSTVIMNVITHEKAYSLFPRATFEERRSLICATAGYHQEPARLKYVNRGWKMITSVPADEQENPVSSFRKGSRWIGDKLCYTIPLSLDGVNIPIRMHVASQFPRDGLSIHSWNLVHPTDPGKTAVLHFFILVSPVLRHNYTISHPALCEKILPMLEEAEQFEKERLARLEKIPIENRRLVNPPLQCDAELQGICDAFHILRDREATFIYSFSG